MVSGKPYSSSNTHRCYLKEISKWIGAKDCYSNEARYKLERLFQLLDQTKFKTTSSNFFLKLMKKTKSAQINSYTLSVCPSSNVSEFATIRIPKVRRIIC